MSICHCGRPSREPSGGDAPGREGWCQDCNDYRCDLPGEDGYRCEITPEEQRAFDKEMGAEYARMIGDDEPREQLFRRMRELTEGGK